MPDKTGPDILIVANRLSVTAKQRENGGYDFEPSSGGLVGAIKGLSSANRFHWYGWPGVEVDEKDQQEVKERLAEQGCVPIFLEHSLADKHYNGFANKIAWPLFHYMLHEVHLSHEDWCAYQQVNHLFAERLAEDMSSGHVAWIQDYHLMLLPAMLREELSKRGKQAKIGFFLHIPFPCSDFFRILPVKRQILAGLLASDLVGFHTQEYQEHFVRACVRILEVFTKGGNIHYEGRVVKTGAIPIGIKPAEFEAAISSENVKKRIGSLREKYEPGTKLIISVDRLDYIKGVPLRLDAIEELFNRYPEYVERIRLLQVIVPSRENIEGYNHIHEKIDQMVNRVNSKFGSIETQPIQCQYSSVSREELSALYAASDACIVSSVRDGMNIVAMEYIACQQERHGTLILSEFTGAADVMDGPVKFNPWDAGEFAEVINTGLSLDKDERAERQGKLYEYITTHTSERWARDFLFQLLHA